MKKTTPFKSEEEFNKELTAFANKHKQVMESHASRISDYFEMTCYNMIVSYYESLGYMVCVQNTKGGKFRYKCSPTGRLENFSYFKASKKTEEEHIIEFYVFHNATVQSAYDDNVFTTPDIVVADTCNPSQSTDYYDTRKVLTFIPKEKLLTFCEAKHLAPFPELLINFIGTVHEIMPQCISGEAAEDKVDHLAPSLMMSGVLNKPTKRIKESFENRYILNILDNLIDSGAHLRFTVRGIEQIKTLKNDFV